MHLNAKFDHPTFNRLEVIVLTNKQTNSTENIHLCSLCYAGVISAIYPSGDDIVSISFRAEKQ